MAETKSPLWTDVDRYFTERLHLAEPGLEAALAANTAAGLPSIDVTPAQGKFLFLLSKLMNASKILEIGTLGGYSTIWLARSLPPGGRVLTLEFNPKHADVARSNIQRADLSDLVEIRVGAALDTLPVIEKEGQAPFDFVFIDADKPNNAAYLSWAIRLSRPGTLIVVDNVIRDGQIANAASTDPAIQGTRQMFDALSRDSRLTATSLQTVGAKGYDGFAMAMVKGTPR